jgi:hypothetical protein
MDRAAAGRPATFLHHHRRHRLCCRMSLRARHPAATRASCPSSWWWMAARWASRRRPAPPPVQHLSSSRHLHRLQHIIGEMAPRRPSIVSSTRAAAARPTGRRCSRSAVGHP